MIKINFDYFFGIFLMLGALVFALIIGARPYGDGRSYYWMTKSIVNDGDFIVDDKDVSRWKNTEFGNITEGIYIFVDKKGIMRYGKPFLYPFIAAPFFIFFGAKGFAVLNGLLLGSCMVFCYLFLRKYLNKLNAILISVLFFFSSYMPVYSSWIHPEMMLFFACSFCLWLFFCENKSVLSALLIGIVSSVKIIFLVLIGPFIVLMISKKEFKRLNKTLAVFFLGAGSMLIFNFLFFGHISPYTANNRGYTSLEIENYFTSQEVVDAVALTSSQLEGVHFNSWGLFFRNLQNFFIGRFTGIIWYAFPIVVLAGVYLVYRSGIQKQERIFGDSILASALLLILILVALRPLNYFGGKGFICNRYFFILPALLFLPAIKKVKNLKIIFLLFLPGLVVNAHILNYQLSEKAKTYYFHKYPYLYSAGLYTRIIPLLKYAPLEISQVESLPIYSVKIDENISFYFPFGAIKKNKGNILIGKGQEIVIVENYENNFLLLNKDKEVAKNKLNLKLGMHNSAESPDEFILRTDSGTVTLNPRVTLRNIKDKKYKRFYYFKVKKIMFIQLG